MGTCIYIYILIYIYIYIYTYTHTNTIYIYIYIYMYTCICIIHILYVRGAQLVPVGWHYLSNATITIRIMIVIE